MNSDNGGIHNLSATNFTGLIRALNASLTASKAALWESLRDRQHVFVPESPRRDIACRRSWLCTLTSMTPGDYAECLGQNGAAVGEVLWARLDRRTRWIIIGVTVAAALFLCLCLACYGTRYLRRRHYQAHVSEVEPDGIRKESTLTTTAAEEDVLDDDDEVPMELPEIA